ncbi:hypothetical protein AG1IA_04886 [Rhizoctonia solani AG-1 IA]|uniref:Uncharacterized protein n=1 Tax=Thanatephorus cucumeris (strain AG1-IA) TaxID=983506 RepID=L8WXI8_THACA|nr:hypothetical protein AG1IA_04886 [Rhizoctonia solani AG-1 IA]
MTGARTQGIYFPIAVIERIPRVLRRFTLDIYHKTPSLDAPPTTIISSRWPHLRRQYAIVPVYIQSENRPLNELWASSRGYTYIFSYPGTFGELGYRTKRQIRYSDLATRISRPAQSKRSFGAEGTQGDKISLGQEPRSQWDKRLRRKLSSQ